MLAAAAEVLETPLPLNVSQVEAALDAWDFVRARTLPGGPAPDTVRAAIVGGRARLEADLAEVAARHERLAASDVERGRLESAVSSRNVGTSQGA